MTKEYIFPLRVHIEDTDYTGLVYHANYLNYMERARSEWVDSLGFGMDWQKRNNIFFVVHTANIRYIKPARVHERLEVVTTLKSVRPASLIFDQCLRLADMPDKILCKAEIKAACVGEDMQPRAIPDVTILETIRR